jgi:stress-induced-phosphoprotein 1
MTTAADFKNAGNTHLQNGQYQQAIDAYTKAIALDATDHIFFSNRSAAYLSNGDAINALKDSEQCIKLKSDWPKGFSRKGAALHSLRRYDDAIMAYQAGLAIAPTDAGLKSGLEEVKKAQASQSPRGFNLPPQFLAKLATHPKFGPKMADPAFQGKLRMMQTNPDLMLRDPEMMEVLTLMIGGGENGEMPNFETASEPPSHRVPEQTNTRSEPPRPAPKVSQTPAQEAKERGNNFYKAKQFPEALTAYDEAITLDPTNMLLLNNKAAVYIEMNEIDTAIEWCNRAIELGRTHRASYEDVAKVYQRLAGAELKRSNIADGIAYYRKAQMEHFDKNIERKIKNLELELKEQQRRNYINPELGQEAKEKGNIAFREGNFAMAIEHYEEAIKRDPTNAAYFNNLAAALLKIGDFNSAKTQVMKSIELDKNYVKAWAKKGDIEFFMKEYHKAMDSYRRGLQIEPDNALCTEGLRKTAVKVNVTGSEEEQKERAAHAMADPEIQSILSDPMMRQILQDMQENPSHAQRAMKDPVVMAKLEKLIASGILQIK